MHLKEHIQKYIDTIVVSIQYIYTEQLDVSIQTYLQWFCRLLNLQFTQKSPNLFVPKKGQIYFVELGTNIGTEINKKRPCVIYSDGSYNGGGTVIVLPIKGNYGKVHNDFAYPVVPDIHNGLGKPSCVSFADIRCVSKKRVQGYIGDLDDVSMQNIDAKIIRIFAIQKTTNH